MENKETIIANKGDKMRTIAIDESDEKQYTAQVIAPIVTHGDPIGTVILLSKEPDAAMGEVEYKIASTAAAFLSKQME